MWGSSFFLGGLVLEETPWVLWVGVRAPGSPCAPCPLWVQGSPQPLQLSGTGLSAPFPEVLVAVG